MSDFVFKKVVAKGLQTDAVISGSQGEQNKTLSPFSPVQTIFNSTVAGVKDAVFQSVDVLNIPKPAHTSMSAPEMFIIKQIADQQERNDNRLEEMQERLKEKREDAEIAKNLTASVKEPQEIMEKIQEMQEDFEGVMEVVEKVRVVNETGRVVSERTVARHRRVVADLEGIIDRAGKYGVDKEEILDKLGRLVGRCKVPKLKDAMREILEDGKIPAVGKEKIAEGLGKIVNEESERLGRMQKQNASDKRKITVKVQGILDEQKGYSDAVKGLMGILERSQKEGDKFRKEDLLKDLMDIAGKCKQGIGRELQDMVNGARKDERKKEDVIADLREAAGKYLRKLSVIEAVQKLMPGAAGAAKEDLVDRVQGVVAQWKSKERELESIEREMRKMAEQGISEKDFQGKAKGLLQGKPDIGREVLTRGPVGAADYVHSLIKEMQGNEHIQEIKDVLARPLGKDELVDEINRMVQGESEAVMLSKKITSILKKAEKPETKTSDLVKDLRAAAKIADETELNVRIRMILHETEKRGMGKDYITSKLKEIASANDRQIEIAAGISHLVSEKDKMTKKELVKGMGDMISACRREASYFENIFKNLVKILTRKPTNEEFFVRMREQLQGREWVAKDIEKRKLNPGQATETVRELAEGMMSNPYIRRMDQIVKKEQSMQKSEIVKLLEDLESEIKQIKGIVDELMNLVQSASGKDSSLEKEDLISAVEQMAKTTSSDRLGRKLLRMATRARKEGLSKDDLIHEIRKSLPSENNILTMFSRLRVALENDDSKEVNRLTNILYQVNSEIVSVDVAVRKAMSAAETTQGSLDAKRQIAESARGAIRNISQLSRREEERNTGMEAARLLELYGDEEDQVKKGKLLDSVVDLCAQGGSSAKRIIAAKFDRFLRDCSGNIGIQKGVPNGCTVKLARLCLFDKDFNTKIAGTKLVSRYFDFISDNAWRLDRTANSRHIDEAVGSIITGALTGPERLKMSALNALRKVAVQNHKAASAIRMLAGDREERISNAAKEVIKELML